MDEDQAPDQASLFPKTLGDRLRDAREAKGLALSDIASSTRVPIRHLEAIEEGRFDGLPSPTYAIGFAKSYARAVGMDEATVAAELRANPQLPMSPSAVFEDYIAPDPKRVPTRGVAMVAGLLAVAVLAAVAIWYGSAMFSGSGDVAPLPVPEASETIAAGPEAATPPPATGGQVTLTATDSVWLRVYDSTGKRLFEKTLQPGERYDVPSDASNPMINIGRPDKLQVTINGSQVAPLGDGKVAIKDVPISAAALQARGQPGAAPAATPTPIATTAAGPAPAATKSSSRSSRSSSDETPRAFRTPSAPSAAPTPAPNATSVPSSAPTPLP